MDTLSPELREAIAALGAAVRDLPALRAYKEATARMRADRDVVNLLDQLQGLQAELRVKQASGLVTREDIARLRHLQQAVQMEPAFTALMAAQTAAQACLPPINQEISRMLGIDFVALAAPAGGCCG